MAQLSATDAALAVASLPVAGASLYLAVLAMAARRTAPPSTTTTLAFDLLVPAHDEERDIAATVASLLALHYPPERYRVVVIADNCSDRTAELARAAGAVVLERHDPERRGKGYALAHGYEASFAEGFADAVVVVDADTVVSANLLTAFAARFAAGAECVQAEYGVRNPDASWRTRLMTIAFTLYHTVRSLGRERLGLSCGLRGNGMAFTAALLRRVPHRAFSVVEDVEYGVQLGLAGVRVAYAGEAVVLGEMPATGAASRTQRERWEGGRVALVRRYLPPLVRAAVARRSVVALDLAADLLVPPLTLLAALSGLGAAVALWLAWAGLAGVWGVAGWAAAVAGLAVYVGRGWALAGTGVRGALDLLWAPVYAIWKLTLLARPSSARGGTWVRTERGREGVTSAGPASSSSTDPQC